MRLSPRADAVVGRRAPTTDTRYPPPRRPTYHTSTVAAERTLEARIRRVLLDCWRAAIYAPSAARSQMFRDQARGEGRPLGLVTLEKGLRTLDDPACAQRIADELHAWVDETFLVPRTRPMGVQHWGIR